MRETSLRLFVLDSAGEHRRIFLQLASPRPASSKLLEVWSSIRSAAPKDSYVCRASPQFGSSSKPPLYSKDRLHGIADMRTGVGDVKLSQQLVSHTIPACTKCRTELSRNRWLRRNSLPTH